MIKDYGFTEEALAEREAEELLAEMAREREEAEMKQRMNNQTTNTTNTREENNTMMNLENVLSFISNCDGKDLFAIKAVFNARVNKLNEELEAQKKQNQTTTNTTTEQKQEEKKQETTETTETTEDATTANRRAELNAMKWKALQALGATLGIKVRTKGMNRENLTNAILDVEAKAEKACQNYHKTNTLPKLVNQKSDDQTKREKRERDRKESEEKEKALKEEMKKAEEAQKKEAEKKQNQTTENQTTEKKAVALKSREELQNMKMADLRKYASSINPEVKGRSKKDIIDRLYAMAEKKAPAKKVEKKAEKKAEKKSEDAVLTMAENENQTPVNKTTVNKISASSREEARNLLKSLSWMGVRLQAKAYGVYDINMDTPAMIEAVLDAMEVA